jgi:cytochrome c556
MHEPDQRTTTIFNQYANPTVEENIQKERTQLDKLTDDLRIEQNTLNAKYKKISEAYAQLRKMCSHPQEHFRVELEEGVYGGKTKTCLLCGWSHYSD